MRAPLTTYRYNIIGAPVQYSCHPSFPQLQDMQNPSFIVIERKIEKEKNYRIVCLHKLVCIFLSEFEGVTPLY